MLKEETASQPAMNTPKPPSSLLSQLDGLNEQQLRRLLTEYLTKQKLGLYWEANAIERDAALNATCEFNESELNFAKALDRTDFAMCINDDGSIADVVDFDNLSHLKSWTRNRQPSAMYLYDRVHRILY